MRTRVAPAALLGHLLLAGCDAGEKGGRVRYDDVADDSGGGTCAPVDPFPIADTDAAGIADAIGLNLAWLRLFDGNVLAYAEWKLGDDDPCVSVSDDGVTTTLTGACKSTDGVDLWGTASFVRAVDEADGTESMTSTYSGFHFDDLDASGTDDVDIDGAWATSTAADGTWGAAADLTATRNEAGNFTGTTTWSLSETGDDAGYTASGYVDIARQAFSDATGDLCVTSVSTTEPACATEPNGVDTLTGAAGASLTWSGATSCDGCADVELDDGTTGVWCGAG